MRLSFQIVVFSTAVCPTQKIFTIEPKAIDHVQCGAETINSFYVEVRVPFDSRYRWVLNLVFMLLVPQIAIQ